MAMGNVPPQLKEKWLVSLNMASLWRVPNRGEFEGAAADCWRRSPQRGCDLFVDEMHTIVGAGPPRAIDARIFKPALGGENCNAGCTTRDEIGIYRKRTRRWSAVPPVLVRNRPRRRRLAILRALRPGLERHHICGFRRCP